MQQFDLEPIGKFKGIGRGDTESALFGLNI
jgi:hypothetical protein